MDSAQQPSMADLLKQLDLAMLKLRESAIDLEISLMSDTPAKSEAETAISKAMGGAA